MSVLSMRIQGVKLHKKSGRNKKIPKKFFWSLVGLEFKIFSLTLRIIKPLREGKDHEKTCNLVIATFVVEPVRVFHFQPWMRMCKFIV